MILKDKKILSYSKIYQLFSYLKVLFLPAITLSFQQTVGRVAHEKFGLLSAEAL